MRRFICHLAVFIASLMHVLDVHSRSDDGKVLAGKYCQSCHVQPLPEHLDKPTWVAKVFPIMRKYLGLDQLPQRETLPHDLAAFYPTFPAMSEDEWFAVAQWYIDNAPSVLPQPAPVKVEGITERFESIPIVRDVQMPMTTLVKFDVVRKNLIIGDGMGNALFVTDLAGKAISRIALSGPPSCVEVRPDAWYVTDMGRLLPHDSAIGSLLQVTWVRDSPMISILIDSLRRPVHVVVADMNADGRNDYLICEYGNLIGRFGWYEISSNGKKKYHSLAPVPGAIRAVLRDINGDGKLDIIVQMAQAREGLFAYMNKGKGRYVAKELLVLPPSFGSSSFEFADANGDGIDDIVVTTGDNGDYDTPPLKPYHGVYVFTARKDGSFRQEFFQHLDGAYGAKIRDFDGNGTKDMLSFSYFPRLDRGDYDLLRYDSGVMTSSVTSWRVANAEIGRWLVSDVADVDGDGDDDMLIGNVSIGPGTVPEETTRTWMNNGVVALYLRNTTK